MNPTQANEFLLRVFDGPYDAMIDCEFSDAEINAIVMFLKREGYIYAEQGDTHIQFTENGYAILFNFHNGTNVEKLSTFGILKKLAEKFCGPR
jgi:hypothetical protein